jgi:DNA-cytosine methyltransferase
MVKLNLLFSDYLKIKRQIKMIILSLFDGISGARLSLQRAGSPVTKYYSTEIDKHALRISRSNFPDNIQLGDVRNITASMIPEKVDVLCFGAPCVNLSSLNNTSRHGLQGEKSGLFYEALRLKKELNPTYFLCENVSSMSNENRNLISELLGVEPIKINSALLTAQSRNRYYWTNITGITQPADQGQLLENILESGYTEKQKSSCLTASYASSSVMNYFLRSERQRIFTCPITATSYTMSGFTTNYYQTATEKIQVVYNKKEKYIKQKDRNIESLEKLKKITRKLSALECERLQGLPPKYCYYVSDRQQYKAIGNGFNIPTVAHIFSFLRN